MWRSASSFCSFFCLFSAAIFLFLPTISDTCRYSPRIPKDQETALLCRCHFVAQISETSHLLLSLDLGLLEFIVRPFVRIRPRDLFKQMCELHGTLGSYSLNVTL